MSGGRGRWPYRASAAGAGSRKHAQIRRRYYAVRVRRVLDRRRPRRRMAGRGPRDRRICGDVSGCQQRSHRARSPPENEGLVMMILLRELAGLFVDDGALALAILAVVSLAGMAAVLMPNTPSAAGAVLLFGCLTALVSSVARTDRR